MFNTMTITKTAGALIGSLLFLLLVSWGASALYSVGAPESHAEGEAPAQAYSIAVENSGAAGAGAATEEVDFSTLLASADPARGEKAFGKCKSCHSVEGKDGVGPHLNGVVGRAVASVAGYNYDDAMKKHATEAPNWTPEALQEFLTNPKGVVPGTKMAFAGLPRPQERADLIAFLQKTGG